ncbi:MAG: phosphoribosyltransferase family protein [Candidatus Paceibacterota bacterium]|jgi:orotate phosphoribosyltransferase
MMRSTEDWISQYQEKGAFWLHDGNPKRPHALLTRGKHSSGFFDSELVMEDSILLDEATSDLVLLLQKRDINLNNVDRVLGPSMGAITLAHDISRHIGHNCFNHVLRAYAEKETNGNSKTMVFKRTVIRTGEHVLVVDDVLTTGDSVGLTVTAVINAGGIVMPFIAVLVNRSGLKEVDGRKIIALIDHSMPKWMPVECPLCKEGSEAIRPKEMENWARLNASY